MYISRRRRCIGPFAFGERGRPNGLEGEKGRRVAASESRPVTYCKEENGVVSAEDGHGRTFAFLPALTDIAEDDDDVDGDELLQRIN